MPIYIHDIWEVVYYILTKSQVNKMFTSNYNQESLTNFLNLLSCYQSAHMFQKQSNLISTHYNQVQQFNPYNQVSGSNIQTEKTIPIYKFKSERAASSQQTNHFPNLDEKQAKSGNIFQKRENWSILNELPIEKQNTIHIRLEDDGPYGNDEIRCFVLSHLSKSNIITVNCLHCRSKLPVYDRFPLIDGTLFASPFKYNDINLIPAVVSGKNQFIYGLCIKCLNGTGSKRHQIKCKHCYESWDNFGKSVQIGTFYKYDLFAASPCCQMRVDCKNCKQPLIDLNLGGLPYFSSYSEKKQCKFCLKDDYHFIKNLDEIFLL